MKGDR